MNDDNSVAGEVDVELEAVGARGEPAIERRDGIFRASLAATAMRKHEGAGRSDRRMHRAILAGIESGMPSISTVKTLGDLRRARAASPEAFPRRSVKNEVRDNLIAKLRSGETLFPGIIGYDETVIPQLVNAVLSRHNFILLGLRGQAKSRILRALVSLLDEHLPVVAGCEIHDDPLEPICSACRMRIAAEGDETNVAWLPRDARYVEKLATPDVTIADMLGDIDPIKAARSGLQLSDELTIHYGLLPRANRGIFGINELPDLAGKIQVGLFNILQEGDIQIKGYPVRLPLDLLMVFTANPEDYTARGKIITPLKDRIGSEIRTHYPATRQHAMDITMQEAWLNRGKDGKKIDVPVYVREVVEEIAFQARADRKIDRRSGVSQRLAITCLENVLSNAERRAPTNAETQIVARVTDVYAALPSITGKFEMEYEGELKGADNVARELIRASVANVFAERFDGVDMRRVVEWFDLGGSLQTADTLSAKELVAQARGVQGLVELADHLQIGSKASEPAVASAVDFVLEGLYAQKKISRSDDRGYHAAEQTQRRQTPRAAERDIDEGLPMPGGKKKYYN
jgi:magnesium chelatase subunit I